MNAQPQTDILRQLTGIEYALFQRLQQSEGSFVSKNEIAEFIYPSEAIAESNCIEVFVSRMRKKGLQIQTARGKGYRLKLTVFNSDNFPATEPTTNE